MNSANNIINVVRSIVEAMTPTITITANVADGANWKLSMCKTYWITPNQYVTIGGETFKVLELSFNDYIIVSNKSAAQPVGPTFQLDAPDFVHGSSRKVDNERKAQDDVTNMFVYLPRPRVREDGRYDSDIAYTASIRPLFLIGYDTTRDNTEDQQSDFIDPMNAAADLFEFIVDNNNSSFDETEFYNREEWMNFGNPAIWGNDSLIFDAPLSGVELSLDLIVLKDFACLCDGAEPVTCPDVTHSFQGTDTGITTNPGGNLDVSVVDQFGADTGTKISETPNEIVVEVVSGGADVTTDFNSTPTGVDTPAGDNIAINVVDDDDTPIGTLETNTANLKEIRIANSNVSNSDDTYSVDVLSEQNLEIPDITVTDSDGSTSSFPAAKNVVCTPVTPVTDIIYIRDLWQAGDQETLTDGSLGWYKANTTIFADTQPASGLGVKLDPNDDTKLLTPNVWGNLNRVTNDKGAQNYIDVGGGLTSDGATAGVMLDNYTWTVFTRDSVHAGTQNWTNSVVTAKAHTVARYDGSTYNQWQMPTPKLVQHILTTDGDQSNIFTGIHNWSKDAHFLMGVTAGGGNCYFWRDNQPWAATNLYQSFSKTTVSSTIGLILWANADDYI